MHNMLEISLNFAHCKLNVPSLGEFQNNATDLPPGRRSRKKSIVVAQEHLRGLVLWGFVKYIIPPTVI